MPLLLGPGTVFGLNISDPAKRDRIISNGNTRIAKLFKNATKKDMEEGPHTGFLYEKVGNGGYRRSHRASRVGEHPSPDTFNLVNSVDDVKINVNTHEVFVVDSKAPYGKWLEGPRFKRHIMHPEDVSKFENGPMQPEVERMRNQLFSSE